MKIKHIITILTASLLTAGANEENSWFAHGLIHPDAIIQHVGDLDLTDEQKTSLQNLVQTAGPKAGELEAAVRAEAAKMEALLPDANTKTEDAVAQLNKLLEAEAALKKFQLQTLFSLRAMLTPEQRTKALEFSKTLADKDDSMESKIRARAKQLKAAFDSLGLPMTDALKARAQAIEELMKSGKMEDAMQSLEALAKESGIEDMARDVARQIAETDFSSLEPGSVDMAELKKRLAAVEQEAQQIVSAKALMALLKAQEFMEKAKENSDPDMLGKILTWAEKLLMDK